MRIEKFYSKLRFIALKRWEFLLKKDNFQFKIHQNKHTANWKREWKEFFLKQLISVDYERNVGKEFRKMQKEKGTGEGWKARLERLDFMLCWFLLGAVPEDYFSMVFFKKGWIWRNHHVTRSRMNFIGSKFNPDPSSKNILNDKAAFCKNWEGDLHRKWCVPEEISLKEFEEKFKDVSTLIAKRRTGYGGKGIMVFETSKTGYKEIYDKVLSQKEPFIVEEFHHQTGWLHEINPSSLNTIRVSTLSINGQTDVIFAYLRVGVNGSVVDNLHSGGIQFPIDFHNGKIFKGMNYLESGIEKHPDSNIKIYGETIPKWDEIVEFCKKAHESAPSNLHWVGWDVCLDEDDMSLIEGNSGPGFPPIENPHENWWKDMQNYLSKLES